MGASSLYYRDAVIGDGPVAFWPLGINGNEIRNRFNGTVAGTVTFNQTFTGTKSREGDTACLFDGVNATKILTAGFASYPFGLGELTIECWIKYTNASSTSLWIYDTKGGTGNGQGFGLSLNNGQLSWRTGGGASTSNLTSTLTTLNDGLWHHIVCGVSRITGTDSLFMYVDGVVKVGAMTQGFNLTSSSQLSMGNTNAGTSPYDGFLAYLSIYNYALNAQQVSNHFTTPYNVVVSVPTVTVPIVRPVINFLPSNAPLGNSVTYGSPPGVGFIIALVDDDYLGGTGVDNSGNSAFVIDKSNDPFFNPDESIGDGIRPDDDDDEDEDDDEFIVLTLG